jgi:glycosyltransferase involved in cell wall biosynthesis
MELVFLSKDSPGSEDLSEISVVVPAYNPGPKLLDCLSSLASMNYPSSRLEVIVVDDCSTEDIVGAVSTHFPQFRMIRRTENGGCDAARRDGIRESSGQIIAHTDADCTVCPDWARRIDANIRAGASAVTGPVLHELALCAQFIGVTQFGHSQSMRNGPAHSFPGCNFAVPRGVMERFGYRQERLRDGSDRLLAWRIASAGLNVAYDNRMIVNHYPPLDLRRILKRWVHYSGVTYRLRMIDPRLPGGWLLGLGPISPFFLVTARLVRDYERLATLSITRRIPLRIALPLAALFPAVRALDACAMLGAQLGHVRSKVKERGNREK